MRGFGRLVLVTIATMSLVIAPAQGQSGTRSSASDSAAAVATVESFHAALASGDTATVMRLLDMNVHILESGGLESREQYISGHMRADMAFASALPRQRDALHASVQGDVAWVVSTAISAGQYRDREVNSQSAELMVLRKQDGNWRIAAIHWSSRNRRN